MLCFARTDIRYFCSVSVWENTARWSHFHAQLRSKEPAQQGIPVLSWKRSVKKLSAHTRQKQFVEARITDVWKSDKNEKNWKEIKCWEIQDVKFLVSSIGREGGSSPTNFGCEICHYSKKAWFSKFFSSLIIAKHDLVCLNDFWTGCVVWQLVFKSKNPPRDVDLCCFLKRWQISHPKFVGDDPPSLPMLRNTIN